jgi:hypothetical protein
MAAVVGSNAGIGSYSGRSNAGNGRYRYDVVRRLRRRGPGDRYRGREEAAEVCEEAGDVRPGLSVQLGGDECLRAVAVGGVGGEDDFEGADARDAQICGGVGAGCAEEGPLGVVFSGCQWLLAGGTTLFMWCYLTARIRSELGWGHDIRGSWMSSRPDSTSSKYVSRYLLVWRLFAGAERSESDFERSWLHTSAWISICVAIISFARKSLSTSRSDSESYKVINRCGCLDDTGVRFLIETSSSFDKECLTGFRRAVASDIPHKGKAVGLVKQVPATQVAAPGPVTVPGRGSVSPNRLES